MTTWNWTVLGYAIASTIVSVLGGMALGAVMSWAFGALERKRD